MLVLTGPLFAPAALAAPYAIAYQDALGLGPALIALLGATATGLGLLFLAAGAVASARWGRLRAMTLFDVTGFLVPWVLLALARSPAEVAAAVLLGATAQGAQAGFLGLLLADAREGQRPRALALEHLLLALPSAAMPLAAGALVGAWGLEPAVRAMYLASTASAGAMVAVRWALLRGVPVGPPPAATRANPLASLRGLHGAGLTPVLAATAFLAFGGGLAVLAQVRVLRVVGLPEFWLGPFAFAVTAADLAATALAARARAPGRAWALAAALAGAAGFAAFVGAREPIALLASGAMLGASGAWAGVGLGAQLHDAVPEASGTARPRRKGASGASGRSRARPWRGRCSCSTRASPGRSRWPSASAP